jgi:PBP1b-binding outer membrane lipoprotein LpoB
MILLAVAVTGCSADKDRQNKAEQKHYQVKETDIKGVEEVKINGSPTPPEGYERPVVDEKKIKESMQGR